MYVQTHLFKLSTLLHSLRRGIKQPIMPSLPLRYGKAKINVRGFRLLNGEEVHYPVSMLLTSETALD